MANADVHPKAPLQDDFRTRISDAVSRRGTANAMWRRAIHPAVARNHRETRSRNQHNVNPDAIGRIDRRDLASNGVGAKRGLQFSDRGLETRDVSAADGDGDGAAARPAYHSDPARMGGPALVASRHLHSGTAARRHDRDVLAAGAAGTG